MICSLGVSALSGHTLLLVYSANRDAHLEPGRQSARKVYRECASIPCGNFGKLQAGVRASGYDLLRGSQQNKVAYTRLTQAGRSWRTFEAAFTAIIFTIGMLTEA